MLDGTTALFEGLIVLGVLATVSATARLRPRLQGVVGVSAAAVLLLTAPVTVAALAAGPGHSHEWDSGHAHQPEPGHAGQSEHSHDAAHAH